MYGPEEPVFDGSYKLPDIEALEEPASNYVLLPEMVMGRMQ